jgi:hypothetical protein
MSQPTIESILELTGCKNLQELEDLFSSIVSTRIDPMLALYNECVEETSNLVKACHLTLSEAKI